MKKAVLFLSLFASSPLWADGNVTISQGSSGGGTITIQQGSSGGGGTGTVTSVSSGTGIIVGGTSTDPIVYLRPDTTMYIQNQSLSVQQASFTVLSGTVTGRFYPGSIVFQNGTVQVSSPPVIPATLPTTLPLPPGDTNYIQNRTTLQDGATAYISSMTVNGYFVVNSVPATGIGSEFSRLGITPSNNTFGNIHSLSFVRYGNVLPAKLNIQSAGSDGQNLNAWSSYPQSGISFSIADQGTLYFASGAGSANNTGNGETVVFSSATGFSTTLPHKDTFAVYSSSALGSPILGAYSSDSGANGTVRFQVGQSTINVFLPVIDSNNSAGTSGQVYKSNGSGLAATWQTDAGSALPLLPNDTNYIQNRPLANVQANTTAYPDFLYMRSSGTFFGPLTSIAGTAAAATDPTFIMWQQNAGSSRKIRINFNYGPVATVSTGAIIVGRRGYEFDSMSRAAGTGAIGPDLRFYIAEDPTIAAGTAGTFNGLVLASTDVVPMYINFEASSTFSASSAVGNSVFIPGTIRFVPTENNNVGVFHFSNNLTTDDNLTSGTTFFVTGGTTSFNGIPYRWPNTRGTASQVLTTDGAATGIQQLSFTTPTSGSGDNLGNHIATMTLDMAGFGIINIASMSATTGTINGAGILSENNTYTLTNKTFDANGTGNTLSWTDFAEWNNTDGIFAGTTYYATLSTVSAYGHLTFAGSNSSSTCGGYVLWHVPADFDTTGSMTMILSDYSGTESSSRTYIVSVATFGTTMNVSTMAYSTPITISMSSVTATQTAGFSRNFTSASTALTGWPALLTADGDAAFSIRRQGDSATLDTSTIDSYFARLIVRYPRKQ